MQEHRPTFHVGFSEIVGGTNEARRVSLCLFSVGRNCNSGANESSHVLFIIQLSHVTRMPTTDLAAVGDITDCYRLVGLLTVASVAGPRLKVLSRMRRASLHDLLFAHCCRCYRL